MSKKQNAAALTAALEGQVALTAKVESLAGSVAQLVALMTPSAPAKVVIADTPAQRAVRKEAKAAGDAKFAIQRKAGVKAAKRNAPASARLSRKAWNDAFVAKAKFSGLRDARGVSLYRVALNRWDEVQAMRDNLVSPDKALEALKAGKRWA